MKYRNEKITDQMLLIEFLLTAISEKKLSKLNVTDILAKDDDHALSLEQATIIGMRGKANESMIAIKALAMGFDRVVAMVGAMLEQMDNANMTTASLYEKRLEILTDFSRIMEELNPEMVHKFAQM